MASLGLRTCGRLVLGVAACICMAASPADRGRPLSTPTPKASPAPKLTPPPASALPGTPDGIIGPLERNRHTAPAVIAAYISSSDPALAARAVLGLGRLNDPAAIPMVSAALNDASRPSSVRQMAAFALGLLGTRQSIAPLVAATRGRDPMVAGLAADALGRIGADSAVGPLSRLLSARDASVRGRAAVGLGEAGLATAKTPLTNPVRITAGRAVGAAFGTERDPEVRWRLAWAIARGYYGMSAPVMRSMLGDREPLVRRFGAYGLGKLKDRANVTAVRLLARDPAWRVRVEVRNALKALRDDTFVDVAPPPVPASDQLQPQAVSKGAPLGDHPQVAFVTTKGTFVIELFPDQAAYQVDNFASLVDRGFYDKTQFFRVIADFVIQGGDPTNRGDGDAGYTIPAELNPLEQLTGVIALGLNYDDKTNTPLLDSGGSQYYVTQSPQLHLDAAFSTFGRVVKGLAVVDAIREHDASSRDRLADTALKVYRCVPVTTQSDDVERRLRTDEIGYDPQ
jgi:peptidyl-prolyl cis-trans isomerase B (cyclophilin B)